MSRALLVAECSLLLQEHEINSSPFSTVKKKDTCRPTIFSEEKLADYIAILGSTTDLLPKDKEYLHFLNKTAWENTWQDTIVETCHKISCVCPTFRKKGMTAELRPSQQY